jgi:hypothetical protein
LRKDISVLENKKLEVARSVPKVSSCNLELKALPKSYDGERAKIGELTEMIDSREDELLEIGASKNMERYREVINEKCDDFSGNILVGIYLGVLGIVSRKLLKRQ